LFTYDYGAKAGQQEEQENVPLTYEERIETPYSSIR
jgi:hypothetical protein